MISFGISLTASVPQSFPRRGEGERFQIIAPFWSDVDTRRQGAGEVLFRQTNASDLLQKAGSEIRQTFRDFHSFVPSLLLIATWDHVSSYRRQSETVIIYCVVGWESYLLN